jgi:hypothetical protein
MRHIHLIDTSNATDNVGDEIIVDSALKILGPLLADAYVSRSSGHDGLGEAGRRLVKTADMALLLGTNALSDKLRLGGNFMWRVGLADLPVLRNKVVLFGVGANRDFRPVSPLQKRFLSHVLSRDHLHAVRDTGGKRIVEAAGRQVANTSCHTLWGDLPLQSVPPGIAPRVVLTLTRHKAHPSDAVLLSTLLGLYPEVWFWPQQPRDLGYLRQLPGAERVRSCRQTLPPMTPFWRRARWMWSAPGCTARSGGCNMAAGRWSSRSTTARGRSGPRPACPPSPAPTFPSTWPRACPARSCRS